MRTVNAGILALVLAGSFASCRSPTPAAGPGGVSCNQGFVRCLDSCVDVQTDRANCHTCGNACGEGLSCISGACSCPAQTILCDGACVDPRVTAAHCGASGDCSGPRAGQDCKDDQTCRDGACRCPDGWVQCDGSCIDPAAFPGHCGASGDCTGPSAGAACAADQQCLGGLCVCATDLVLCGAACIDPRKSDAHCGASADCLEGNAGVSCPEHASCTGGVCVCSGGVLCEGNCIDPGVSDRHCGATEDCTGLHSGAVCTDPDTCLQGACVDPDAALAALAVTPGTMTPVFDGATTEYQIALDVNQTGFVVTATPLSPQASLTIDGIEARPGLSSSLFPVEPDAARDIEVAVTAPGGATRSYQLHVRRQHIPYLKPSNNGSGYQGFFGEAVAISGDTLAVGAPYESGASTGINGDETQQTVSASGAVYVFRLVNGVWAQEAYIKASNTHLNDVFGITLSLSGDTLAVGAPGESSGSNDPTDTSAPGAGAVFVFARSGGVWSQKAYLKALHPEADDQFGASVSLSNDELAVSAPEDASASNDPSNHDAPAAGAAYVFTRAVGVWTQEAYLKPDHISPAQRFGTAVAISGDILAVGTVADSSVYLFNRTTGIWKQTDQLIRDDGAIDNTPTFGHALALDGTTLAASAYGASTSMLDESQPEPSLAGSGAVWVFRLSDGKWGEEAYLKAANADGADAFGIGLSLSGDRLVVGAVNEASASSGIDGNPFDNSLGFSGAAYLFSRAGSIWTQTEYIKALHPGTSDYFGSATSIDGGLYAVGAEMEAGSASGVDGSPKPRDNRDSGAVYVY